MLYSSSMPTKTKATHIGTCQYCGARHKLPDGQIARHGYKVEIGMSYGACHGSYRLPYETDKSVIEQEIERGTRYIAENPYVAPPAGYNAAARNDEPVEHREWRSRNRARYAWERELPRLQHALAKWQPRELTPIC
jgi:hypothetical protein